MLAVEKSVNFVNIFQQDFEACIKTLQAIEYSRPNLTAAKGVSAGGLVVGAVCNRSPDLLKAAILKVMYCIGIPLPLFKPRKTWFGSSFE